MKILLPPLVLIVIIFTCAPIYGQSYLVTIKYIKDNMEKYSTVQNIEFKTYNIVLTKDGAMNSRRETNQMEEYYDKYEFDFCDIKDVYFTHQGSVLVIETKEKNIYHRRYWLSDNKVLLDYYYNEDYKGGEYLKSVSIIFSHEGYCARIVKSFIHLIDFCKYPDKVVPTNSDDPFAN